MQKIILTKEQISQLIWENRYKIEEKSRFLSRCIDGRYQNNENLNPLAFPGADAGELALIFATANDFGFEIDEKKILATLLEVVGGVKNFNLHTDHHGDPKIVASGCGHVKQMRLDSEAYSLEKDQIKLLENSLLTLKKNGANEAVLQGKHEEGAVIIVRGNYSLYPRFRLNTEGGAVAVEFFVFHESLVNERHKILAKKLLENKAVKLIDGCDEEYLYEALSDMTDHHLFETAKRLAKDLPIYGVTFSDDGMFMVEDMGKV